MSTPIHRKIAKALRNVPNLWEGYNIYVNRDKLRLIDLTFRELQPAARSFADLGGAWKVNGAYSIHAMKAPGVQRGVLVDTNFPPAMRRALTRYGALETIEGDFASERVVERIGNVDVILLFDVLLHQANPDWDEVLARYAPHSPCFVIYNQQFVRGTETVRLTDLPYEEYVALTSDHADELIRQVYRQPDAIHPEYGKPWKDIHNITQWGITDEGLRAVMARLGYREAHYERFGMFVGLPAFEERAVVFVRR